MSSCGKKSGLRPFRPYLKRGLDFVAFSEFPLCWIHVWLGVLKQGAHFQLPPKRPCLDCWPLTPMLTTGVRRDKWVGPTDRPWNPGLFKPPRGLRIWLKTSCSNPEVFRRTIYETDKSTTALWVQSPVEAKCLLPPNYPTPISIKGMPRGVILGCRGEGKALL